MLEPTILEAGNYTGEVKDVFGPAVTKNGTWYVHFRLKVDDTFLFIPFLGPWLTIKLLYDMRRALIGQTWNIVVERREAEDKTVMNVAARIPDAEDEPK